MRKAKLPENQYLLTHKLTTRILNFVVKSCNHYLMKKTAPDVSVSKIEAHSM